MTYRVILLKLLSKAFESDFLDGNLYLNTNAYFGVIDHTDSVRFDPYDGIDESRHGVSVDIQDEAKVWLPLPIVGPFTVRVGGSTTLNVLCLFTVTDRSSDSFDSRNFAFGEVAVVIDNLTEFIRRVKRSAADANKKVHLGPIQYVERETHDGPMGPFRKFAEHSYQNEFRFVLTNGSGTACRLAIGDIRDIAHSISTTEIPLFWQEMLGLDADQA